MFKDGFTVLNDFTKCSCFTAVASSPFSCNANKAAFKKKKKETTWSAYRVLSCKEVIVSIPKYFTWNKILGKVSENSIYGYLTIDKHRIRLL